MNNEKKKLDFKYYYVMYESASVSGIESFYTPPFEIALNNIACRPDDNGIFPFDLDLTYSGIPSKEFHELPITWGEVQAGVSNELIISEYKKFDPDLKYLIWWYGNACEEFILPYGIDYHLIRVILARWEAYDTQLTSYLCGTGQLVHRVMRLLRVSFSELCRLEKVHRYKAHEAMNAVITFMINTTSPRQTEFFSHFEPPVYNEEMLVSKGAGIM
ncbi:hypothetical protein [Spirochaeta dissipatitropha]